MTVGSVDQRVEGPSINLLAGFNRSLLDWLVDHIKTVDMEMGRFIRPERWLSGRTGNKASIFPERSTPGWIPPSPIRNFAP